MNSESKIPTINIADRIFLRAAINLIPPSGMHKPVGLEEDSRHWEPPYSKEHDQKLLDRVTQVLLSINFFGKTKFKDFSICFDISNFWVQGKEVRLFVLDGGLWGHRRIYLADFWQMSQREYLDFKTGVAAEIIIAACNKYKLDDSAARQLSADYPVRDIEFSLVTLTPTISLPDTSTEPQFQPLTNEELTFPQHDLYHWCVSDPFTEDQLKKIGPTTLTVRAPVDLPIDQYVQIASAIKNAPLATLWIYSSGQGSDLRFLKHFSHVSRISLDVPEIRDLSCLTYLSKNLVHLELVMAQKGTHPSLEALQHFDNLQSLQLRGHYEDLSNFPKLASLKALLLSDVSPKDLCSLAWLPQLRSLAIADSKISDVTAISKIKTLQYLILARLPKLMQAPDFSLLQQLEYLNLIGLTKLQQIGSLTTSGKLRRLGLNGLKSLTSLIEIEQAPNLEELLIYNMKHLPSESLAWSKNHKTLKALRTDNLALEKASGLKRGDTGKAFAFSQPDNTVIGDYLRPETTIQDYTSPSAESAVDELELEEQLEELHVHIPTSDSFGDGDDHVKCAAIEDKLEQILESEFVGRWSGHETGLGSFDIFYVGENSTLMFEALKVVLKEILPRGSHVEVRERNGSVIVTNY